jgi:hypothetical protein
MWGDVFPLYARGSMWVMSSDLANMVADAWGDEKMLFKDYRVEDMSRVIPHPDDPMMGVRRLPLSMFLLQYLT